VRLNVDRVLAPRAPVPLYLRAGQCVLLTADCLQQALLYAIAPCATYHTLRTLYTRPVLDPRGSAVQPGGASASSMGA
jgi:hypothetical protein